MDQDFMTEYNECTIVLDNWQDDWVQRINAFIAEHGDHFADLRARADNLHLHKGDIKIVDFQDIHKFFTFLGVKEAHTDAERAEQRFVLSAFNQYQAFVEENREISRQRTELQLQLLKNTVAFLESLIVPLDDLIQLENNLKEDETPLLPAIRKLMANRQAFNIETAGDIKRIQEDIALNELKLKTLQKETMN
ncbi:MAG: hypothetical protein JNL70_19990 [Saprospiraceae bacterium]|nr:hypothetical protein [Saprospiraceae bacterium]